MPFDQTPGPVLRDFVRGLSRRARWNNSRGGGGRLYLTILLLTFCLCSLPAALGGAKQIYTVTAPTLGYTKGNADANMRRRATGQSASVRTVAGPATASATGLGNIRCLACYSFNSRGAAHNFHLCSQESLESIIPARQIRSRHYADMFH